MEKIKEIGSCIVDDGIMKKKIKEDVEDIK